MAEFIEAFVTNEYLGTFFSQMYDFIFIDNPLYIFFALFRIGFVMFLLRKVLFN